MGDALTKLLANAQSIRAFLTSFGNTTTTCIAFQKSYDRNNDDP